MKIQPAPQPQGPIKGVAFGKRVPYCINQASTGNGLKTNNVKVDGKRYKIKSYS